MANMPKGPGSLKGMFFHAISKEKLREVCADDQDKRRSDWSQSRIQAARVLESRCYDATISLVIGTNVAIILYDTDYTASHGHPAPWAQSAGAVLLCIYIVELFWRFFAYRGGFFSSSWNILDLVVVVSDLVAEVLRSLIGDFPSIVVLRMCRLFRLFRFMRLLRMFRELDIMLVGFLSAMRAMFWASVMLSVMLTFWSIVAVELLHPIVSLLAQRGEFEGCDRCTRAYSSVMQSNLTFMQQIVAGDSWGQVSIPIIEESPGTFVLFFAVFVSITFGLLNLVLTVIVDVANQARDNDELRKMAEKAKAFEDAKAPLYDLCQELDTDHSGQLSLQELVDAMDANRKFASMMAFLDISKEDMQSIFSVLDEDHSGAVSYQEFIEQLHKLKSQDMHTMLVFIKAYLNDVRWKVDESLGILRDQLSVTVSEMLRRDTKPSAAVQVDPGPASTIEVSVMRARGTGDGPDTGLRQAYCTCEIQGRPGVVLKTDSGRAHAPGLVWEHRGRVEGCSSQDSFLFSVWSRGRDSSDDQLVGRTILLSQNGYG